MKNEILKNNQDEYIDYSDNSIIEESYNKDELKEKQLISDEII